jgi:CRP/FNR family cyclic AMP-dependent transcriptional regulator
MAESILDRLTLQSGDFVFKEGDKGNKAYVVQDGSIEIVVKNGEGEDVVLGMVDKGGIFGEMALIDDQPRMATARAAAGTTLIVINRTMFRVNWPSVILLFGAYLLYLLRTSAPWSNASLAVEPI